MNEKEKVSIAPEVRHLIHLKKWLENLGVDIIVRWKRNNSQLFVFESGKKKSKACTFKEAKAFMVGVTMATFKNRKTNEDKLFTKSN